MPEGIGATNEAGALTAEQLDEIRKTGIMGNESGRAKIFGVLE